jgi:hypothetical protein
MTTVKDISSDMDVKTIIANKNIIVPTTIEVLRKIIEFKKYKTQSSIMVCAQTFIFTSLKQTSSRSHEEVIEVAPPTSTLKVIKEFTLINSTIMAPPSPLSINVMSSSTSTNLKVQFSPKINYFANLPSVIDELNDVFDSYTILYPSSLLLMSSYIILELLYILILLS